MSLNDPFYYFKYFYYWYKRTVYSTNSYIEQYANKSRKFVRIIYF